MRSTILDTAGSSGGATRSTRPRAGPPSGSGSASRGSSADTWWSKAETATAPGTRSPTWNGRRYAGASNGGSGPTTSPPRALSSGRWETSSRRRSARRIGQAGYLKGVSACCPPGCGCNAPSGAEPCALELCRAAAADDKDAALALARWGDLERARERHGGDGEPRFRRRAYERTRDRALISLAMRALSTAAPEP